MGIEPNWEISRKKELREFKNISKLAKCNRHLHLTSACYFEGHMQTRSKKLHQHLEQVKITLRTL